MKKSNNNNNKNTNSKYRLIIKIIIIIEIMMRANYRAAQTDPWFWWMNWEGVRPLMMALDWPMLLPSYFFCYYHLLLFCCY